ncbi:hypothetical protein B0H11DRAFT_2189970 [Mycena galericulata]|nr:hypothetical protein B0H11DRAFT_2189970 [Mycena galericulata]
MPALRFGPDSEFLPPSSSAHTTAQRPRHSFKSRPSTTLKSSPNRLHVLPRYVFGSTPRLRSASRAHEQQGRVASPPLRAQGWRRKRGGAEASAAPRGVGRGPDVCGVAAVGERVGRRGWGGRGRGVLPPATEFSLLVFKLSIDSSRGLLRLFSPIGVQFDQSTRENGIFRQFTNKDAWPFSTGQSSSLVDPNAPSAGWENSGWGSLDPLLQGLMSLYTLS